ncbi:MAG TPA: redoxin domain-containing protein [Vicinamibacteria bacterium]|nr:redoxin domain-containing protein [Vicinamibacteria bacterium]
MRFLGALVALGLTAGTASAAGLAVGQRLQPFKMKQATGQELDLGGLQGRKAYVLAFIATQCPVSNAYNARMAAFAREYDARGVAFIGINSNRQEPPAEIVAHAKQNGFAFPVLKDDNNVKADEFGAQVTPEVYVFDAGWTLRYHGRIDDDRSGSAVESQDLRAAVDAVVAGQEVRLKETKAFGCTIKRVGAQ